MSFESDNLHVNQLQVRALKVEERHESFVQATSN